ncbi:MAG: asparaginase [Burkholderiaceae bacterium]
MIAKPIVTLITCGGTIASAVQAGKGALPTLDIGALAREIPGIDAVAELRTVEARRVPSPHMGFDDLLALARACRDALAAGSQGVVISQGTDTIEEIAYGLDLVLNTDAPVVVTGAMRNASMPGADGPANLLAAVRVAASPTARGLGSLVVFNDEIHAARFVRKSHTQSTATFVSPATGRLGWLAEDAVRILVRPVAGQRLSVPEVAEIPAVALLRLGLGDDGRLLEHLGEAGYAGVVIEGFGGGHVTRAIAAPGRLERLIERMPVVLASRTGSGEVLRGTYGFEGSERDLLARGVIPAGALDGLKARLLLALLLAGGADRGTVKRTFESVAPLCA